MSIFLIAGKNLFQEEETKKRILKEERITASDIVEIDASDTRKFNFETVLIECNTMSLFADFNKKAVIVINPWFLKATTAGKEKKKADNDNREQLLKKLEAYFKSPNPDVCLIFYLKENDPDTRKKEYKLFDKYHVKKYICDLIKPWEFSNHISELLKKNHFVLDNAARKEFDLRVGTDEFQLHNAIEKMKLYGKKNYSLSIIQQLIPEDSNLDIWKLGNYFLQGNLAEVMRHKDIMYENGMTANDIVPLFSSQIRRAYNIAQLQDLGYDQATIAVRLKMKESAVRMNSKNLYGRRAKNILKILSALAQLDQDIKSGNVEPTNAFDLFLLKYGGKA